MTFPLRDTECSRDRRRRRLEHAALNEQPAAGVLPQVLHRHCFREHPAVGDRRGRADVLDARAGPAAADAEVADVRGAALKRDRGELFDAPFIVMLSPFIVMGSAPIASTPRPPLGAASVIASLVSVTGA